MFKLSVLVGVLLFLVGCSSASGRHEESRAEVMLCPQIRLAKPPENHLALHGSAYRDGLVVPTMVTSMSSDEVIAQILKVCPRPLNVSNFSLSLFKEQTVRSGNEFFREQVYNLTSPEYASVHGGNLTAILVWFNPDGSIHGIYNGYTIYAV